jgi:hypothetical protein
LRSRINAQAEVSRHDAAGRRVHPPVSDPQFAAGISAHPAFRFLANLPKQLFAVTEKPQLYFPPPQPLTKTHFRVHPPTVLYPSRMKRPLTGKQLAANRANATHSTGPRTPEGKARAAQNSTTHGLAGAFAILRLEDRDELDRYLADALDFYRPATGEESHAVERIAVCKLAIVRAARLEAGLFTTGLNTALNDDNITPFEALHPEFARDTRQASDQIRNYAMAQGFRRMTENSSSWTLLMRYQAQAERQYRRAIENIERLQRPRPTSPNEPICDPEPELPEPLTPPAVEPVSPLPGLVAAPTASAAPSAAPPRIAPAKQSRGRTLEVPLAS